jgi:2'-5' RNA ligase
VSGEHARLFVALELPAAVRSALESWSHEHVTLMGRVGRVRLVEPESLHVTLCFLGSRPAAEIDAIAATCGVVSSLAPPALTLGAARWLPPRRPRVLAVTLADAQDRLAAVQAALAGALADGGFYEPETRPFFAHVTVARLQRPGRHQREGRLEGEGRPQREGRLEGEGHPEGEGGPQRERRPRRGELPAPEALRFTGDTVTLYRSRLGGGPARYEALTRVTLSG